MKGEPVAVESKCNTNKIRLRIPMDRIEVFGADAYFNVDIEVPCAEELDMSSTKKHLEKLNYQPYEIENYLDLMLDAVYPDMCYRALKDMIVPVKEAGYVPPGPYSGD